MLTRTAIALFFLSLMGCADSRIPEDSPYEDDLPECAAGLGYVHTDGSPCLYSGAFCARDEGGRPTAYCDDPHLIPVCALPGETIRWERVEGTASYYLAGVSYAGCNGAPDLPAPEAECYDLEGSTVFCVYAQGEYRRAPNPW